MTTAATPSTPSLAIAQAISAQFKGLDDWIEIFRSGTHVDSKGRQAAFTNADLDQMIANHKLGAAPAVLGHPKHNDPAYAWTADLKREGDSLLTKFTDINADFEAGVKAGAYRNRSVSIFKDADAGWRLQHVGWLGAARPAISGLKPVEFAGDDNTLEFSSPEVDAVRSLARAVDTSVELLRALREYLIEQGGVELADRVLPTWQLDSLTNSARWARESVDEEKARISAPVFTSPNPNGDPSMGTFTQEQLDVAIKKAREDGEASARSVNEQQFAAQGAELAELRSMRLREGIDNQIEKWAAAGIVTPAMKEGMAEFMASIAPAGSFEFSAADGNKQGKTPADWFAAFVSGMVPALKLGQRSGAEDTGHTEPLDVNDGAAIAAKARQYQADEQTKGNTVSIELAVEHITRSAAQA